jgi:multidrug resistance efflux pump
MNVLQRVGLTALLVILAILAVLWKYDDYLKNPWTRDAEVQAQIVVISPRVTGPIVRLMVKDNELVQIGQPLFNIDPSLYQVALQQSEAVLAQAQAQFEQAKQSWQRAHHLDQQDPGAIAQLSLIKLQNALATQQANVQLAQAKVSQAKLNLSFTHVVSPIKGYVTNLRMQLGTQAVANKPLLAIIDKSTFWVQAFFQETDIKHLHNGLAAKVILMTYPDQPLTGIVTSVGYGIAVQNPTGNDLLQKVNPTFQWIRLAQRMPVRIKLTNLPKDVQLRVGSTASVLINTEPSK